MNHVVGRFAPTPSGRMHLGNLFSALLCWLSVRRQDGELLLRIEDLDTLRCTEENAALLRDDLRWLGLDWDREMPPQRSRSAYYESVLDRLRQRSAEEPWLMIDSNDAEGDLPAETLARGRGMTREELREGISRSMGEIFSALFTAPETGTLLVTGGDTLLGCMRRLGVTELEPVCELYPGVVLSGFAYRGIRRHIITKSGGFGQPSLLPDLKRDFLSGGKERRGEEQEK